VLEPEQLVHFGAARGEHDHRQFFRGGLGAQFLQHLEPVAPRQHQIEHHRVGTRAEQPLQALFAVRGGGNAEAGALEVVAHQIPNLLLVLDHHHEISHRTSAAGC
jgi:hypothetical protein